MTPLVQKAKVEPAVRALARAGQTPRQYLSELLTAKHFLDAVRVLAWALPRREALWWACQCVRQVISDKDGPAEQAALQAATRYVQTPSEEHRRAAAAEAVEFATPAGCAAMAAFWSEGSLAPPEAPARRARELLRAGRLEAAASCFRQALAGQPHNWVLLNEVALFLTFSLRDPRAGADLAKLALAENPMSAELWNTLGDCLFEWGRNAEAWQAYRRAQQLSASSVRARYNLAWVHLRERDYAAALAKLAEALALDWTGEYRERLLQKQQEVLALLTQRHQQEYLRLANRISTAGGDRGPDRSRTA